MLTKMMVSSRYIKRKRTRYTPPIPPSLLSPPETIVSFLPSFKYKYVNKKEKENLIAHRFPPHPHQPIDKNKIKIKKKGKRK